MPCLEIVAVKIARVVGDFGDADVLRLGRRRFVSLVLCN